MDNFNRPYFSKSVAEFWKRWHISLSTWFKDYLYIPLGGNRVNKLRKSFNLFFTFLVSGFWHGANWTYIFWGGLNGLYLIIEEWTNRIFDRFGFRIRQGYNRTLFKYIRVILTFSLICFSWIFFRAKNLNQAFSMVDSIFTNINIDKFFNNPIIYLSLGVSKTEFFIAISVVVFMECVHLVQRHGSIRNMLEGKPLWFRWLLYYCLIFAIIFLAPDTHEQFIYFQF